MKILKYLLFALIGLVILFLAVGLFKPSVSYGHEIKVNKGIKEAWAVSQDASKYDQWLAGFQSIELLSGEEGAVGSTYKVVVKPAEDQSEFVMTETLVSKKEFDHVTMDFASDFMDFKQTITYKEESDGTSVKTDSKVIGKNIISRSMFALMEMFGGSFTKQETINMEALKKVIEENTTDYYPPVSIPDPEPEDTSSE